MGWVTRKRLLKVAREALCQLRRRFGPLAPDVEARVHGADGDQLDAWSERILEAEKLDDLFSGSLPR
ncbi:DUF4351 domain-containing protein [Niveispirillum sp. SYP-B3756]|uniref:DUF4351 domain-containing protein n=1 Tax=Niveispirillum sp. SYP-B3756 TaxID=2662178 RepID=UPI001290BFA2|nr:DUF4351 domain-containing protein [Niveispirillum sp. SYP-B3756]MQP68598.1 DUF4351 domain-containing protein [Niveispirillum sp. SYP-B3756]